MHAHHIDAPANMVSSVEGETRIYVNVYFPLIRVQIQGQMQLTLQCPLFCVAVRPPPNTFFLTSDLL